MFACTFGVEVEFLVSSLRGQRIYSLPWRNPAVTQPRRFAKTPSLLVSANIQRQMGPPLRLSGAGPLTHSITPRVPKGQKFQSESPKFRRTLMRARSPAYILRGKSRRTATRRTAKKPVSSLVRPLMPVVSNFELSVLLRGAHSAHARIRAECTLAM